MVLFSILFDLFRKSCCSEERRVKFFIDRFSRSSWSRCCSEIFHPRNTIRRRASWSRCVENSFYLLFDLIRGEREKKRKHWRPKFRSSSLFTILFLFFSFLCFPFLFYSFLSIFYLQVIWKVEWNILQTRFQFVLNQTNFFKF